MLLHHAVLPGISLDAIKAQSGQEVRSQNDVKKHPPRLEARDKIWSVLTPLQSCCWFTSASSVTQVGIFVTNTRSHGHPADFHQGHSLQGEACQPALAKLIHPKLTTLCTSNICRSLSFYWRDIGAHVSDKRNVWELWPLRFAMSSPNTQHWNAKPCLHHEESAQWSATEKHSCWTREASEDFAPLGPAKTWPKMIAEAVASGTIGEDSRLPELV